MADTRDPRHRTDAEPEFQGEVAHGVYDAAMYGPVADWATDIDHADPQYNRNAPEIWKRLRDGGCPVAHTDRYGGMWAPITHELVNEVAYDTEHFTSRVAASARVARRIERKRSLRLPRGAGLCGERLDS